jgi:hypothetical protein
MFAQQLLVFHGNLLSSFREETWRVESARYAFMSLRCLQLKCLSVAETYSRHTVRNSGVYSEWSVANPNRSWKFSILIYRNYANSIYQFIFLPKQQSRPLDCAQKMRPGTQLPTYRICKFEQPIRSDPPVWAWLPDINRPFNRKDSCTIYMRGWYLRDEPLWLSPLLLVSAEPARFIGCLSRIIGIDLSLAIINLVPPGSLAHTTVTITENKKSNATFLLLSFIPSFFSFLSPFFHFYFHLSCILLLSFFIPRASFCQCKNDQEIPQSPCCHLVLWQIPHMKKHA